MIERGKRNLALDLKNVDYLYSDSINKFINLNHRVLNVYGRLAILSPGEQVSQILQRAGIQNFLKIYETDDELKRSSDEIIQQTTALSVQDIKSYREGPVSEFEDFRSEIGKAIAGTPQSTADEIDNYAQADSAFAQPAHTDQGFAPPIEQYQPSIPTFGEVPFNPNFSPAASQFHDFRQPLAPPPPPPTSFDYSQMPPIPNFDAPPTIQPQFARGHYPDFAQPPSPPPQEFQPPQQRQAALALDERKVARKFERPMEENRFEEEDFEEKKKFPIAAVLVPLILLLILGGGALYLFTPLKDGFAKKKVVQVETTAQKQIAQIEVKEQTPEPVQTPETTAVAETPQKIEEPPVTPVERKPLPTPRPVIKTTTAPKKSTSRPPATVATNRISFSSIPSNAVVSVNGKEIGKTPYTWTDPSVYGMVSISIEKDGYVSQKANMEYTGGSVSKSFELERKPVETVEPVVSTPKQVTTPVSSRPTPTPTIESTEPPPYTPSTSQTSVSSSQAEETPVASTPVAGGGTIFISSLPPMADVYMDGQKIGKTNIAELQVTPGNHEMKFVKGDKELVKTMSFTEGKNPSQLIRLK